MGAPHTNDREYRDLRITKVEEPRGSGAARYYAVTFDDGWSLGLPDIGIAPRVGDPVRLYGRGIGCIVRGVVLRGTHVLYYRTEAEDRAHQEAMTAEENRKRRARFEEQHAQLDAEYAALPPEFQRRLDRFRTHCADFRWQYEGYEMMVCVDAVKLAAAVRDPAFRAKLRDLGIKAKNEGMAWPDTPLGALAAYASINSETNGYNWQLENSLKIMHEGHSGNSHSCAILLAHCYLERPELVEQMHGALTPLVGCEAYGCWHPAPSTTS